MIPILVGTRQAWRSLGRVARVCGLCGDLRAHEAFALDGRAHIYFVSFGQSSVDGYFTLCLTCETTRPMREPLSAPLPVGAPEDALWSAAPEETRRAGDHLISLRAEAATPGGSHARHEFVRLALAALDETWDQLPSRDRVATGLIAGALLAPVLSLTAIAIGGVVPPNWIGIYLVVTAGLFVGLMTLAIAARLTSAARLARKHLLPRARRALAPLPLSNDDARTGIQTARAQGSRVARAARPVDLMQHRAVQV